MVAMVSQQMGEEESPAENDWEGVTREVKPI